MGIKNKPVKIEKPKRGAELFLIGVDEEYVNSPQTDKIPEETKKKKSRDEEEEFVFEPTKTDVAKFRDNNFASNLTRDIDKDQIANELRGWGFDFAKLSNDEGVIDEDQCAILNDYIDQNADYKTLTVVDILCVVIMECEFDWRKFTTILNNQNFDLLKLELAMKYHKRSEVGNATAFLKF